MRPAAWKALVLAISIALGATIGWAMGTQKLREAAAYRADPVDSEESLSHAGLIWAGGLAGCVFGLVLVAWLESIAGRPRFDLFLDTKAGRSKETGHVVAALLGLDPGRARKLVDSGLPLVRGSYRARIEHLHARFADFGVKTSVVDSGCKTAFDEL